MHFHLVLHRPALARLWSPDLRLRHPRMEHAATERGPYRTPRARLVGHPADVDRRLLHRFVSNPGRETSSCPTDKSRPVTFGVIVGNRGFFPDHLAAKRPRRHARRPQERRLRSGRARLPKKPNTAPSKPAKKPRRCADLFRKHSRRDRRHHRHPPQLRRRARHRRHASAWPTSTSPCSSRPRPTPPAA